MPDSADRPMNGESVVDRALAVLGAYSHTRRILSVSEISRATRLPKATAWRMVKRLAHWGALEQVEDGRYVIGVRMWELASLAPRGHGIREIALPHLEDLYADTRQHVILAIRDRNEAVMVDRLSSPDAPEVAYRVGGRMPLDSTAVGRILLAHADVEAVNAVLGAGISREPGSMVHSEMEIRHILAHVSKTGFSIVRRTSPTRTISVAAGVRDASSKVVAALSVVVADGTLAPQALVPAVGTAARTISRSLGYRSLTGPTYLEEFRKTQE